MRLPAILISTTFNKALAKTHFHMYKRYKGYA